MVMSKFKVNQLVDIRLVGSIGCALLMCACATVATEDPDVPAPPKLSKFSGPSSVAAGLPISQLEDKGQLRTLVASKSSAFGVRQDPFALMPEEAQFEKLQSTERMFQVIGGFRTEYKQPVDAETLAPTIEAQPYRRLSGIVVGDSVVAIIEMGDGTYIVRPGQKIPNSEWTVVSIDEDKAVLRRSGDRLPKEIIVRLETPRFGTSGNSAIPGGPGGGIPGPTGAGFPGAGRGNKGSEGFGD